MFTAATTSIFLSDSASSSQIGVTVGALASTAITNGASTANVSADDLTTAVKAQTALGDINTAIANIAGIRGSIGAGINRLQSAVTVINNQVQNLTAAQDQINAANIPQQVAKLSQFTILNQSGISALAQANSAQQSILNLLR